MNTTLIIATYNSPDKLQLCLKSVLRQTIMPTEVIIADDGSTEETRQLIDCLRPQFRVPLVHLWHEDRGFRLAAIRNRAIAQATGDYVIQIDGDIILNRYFVADHIRFASPGYVVLGSRSKLSEVKTKDVLSHDDFEPGLFTYGLERRDSALRCPLISPLFFGNRHTVGCNMAFWLCDLLAVNGYDEAFEGWGHEERDLVLRLQMIGIKKRKLKFAAIQYHLWHHEQSRENVERNAQIIAMRKKSGVSWVSDGIIKKPKKATLDKRALDKATPSL